jgi:arsenate reductase
MAAAFFNRVADPRLARATSAGTQPADRVHPEVLEVVAEVGVDLADARPVLLTPDLVADAACVVTMGCGEHRPVVLGVEMLDWPFPDPKGQGLDAVRGIRDAVSGLVARFVAERGWGQGV